MEQLKGILFIDIETVPIFPSYHLLPENMQAEWVKKARLIKQNTAAEMPPEQLFEDRSGVYSEFAKVICIGFGSLIPHGDKWNMRLKTITGDDEKVLLKEFAALVERCARQFSDFRFCGHNIKEFDIPFLCRRMVINGVALPQSMQLYGKKPWEVNHIDTMDLWRFGDYKNFTSLSLLATVLGIPSPKSDLDGSMVAGVYWHDKDLQRIASYCLQDVFTSARVYLRLTGLHDIEPIAVFVDQQ